jgi:hypothetical protein
MRKLGFSTVAAAIAGAASALISNDFRYGFEFDSYTWRGVGLYTQLWAMHLSFITLALVYQVIRTGRGVMWAIVAFSVLALSHLIYAYMMAIAILVLFLFGLNQANLVPRTVRLGVVVLLTALIGSYMVVPFALESEFLNVSPLLPPEQFASFGIVRIGGWLLTGDLLDHGRLPVLTALLAIGIIATLLGRMRPALIALTLLIVWLVLYAGRPTLGALADLLPFSDGLLFHRFIGGVHLAAILLIGVGGAVVWQLFAPHRRAWQTLAAAFVVGAILVPAYAERAEFYRLNDAAMRRSVAAIEADQDAAAILTTLRSLPPGRTYAGLETNWGRTMALGDVPFYDLLPFEGLEGIRPTERFSLNADLLWDFDERDASDYDLFNVRYVVAPASMPLPDFLRVVRETAAYTLYQAPSGGYATYGAIVARQAFSSQRELYYNNRTWLLGDTLPANHQFIRYDYPARTPGPPPSTGACESGEVSFELFQPGRMDFVVGCPTDGSLVLKTTFHPGWRVSVDGEPVETYMVSPSYLGLDLAAGRHQVTAEYRPDPLKLPLLLAGLAVLLIVVIAGPRLDDAVAAIAVRLPQPRVSLPPMPWSAPSRRRRALPGAIPTRAPPPLEPGAAPPVSAAAAALSAAVAARAVARSPVLEPAEQPSIATAPLVEPALVEEARAPADAGRRRESISERSARSLSALAVTVRSGIARPRRATPAPVDAATAAPPAPPLGVRIGAAFAGAREAVPVLAVSGVTVFLYVLVYLAQRAVNLDGSESSLNPKAPGQVEGELRLYYLATVALFALYAGVVAYAWRRPAVGGLTRTVLLATPVLVQVGLMLDRPYLSTDVLSYLAHGYVGIARGVGNAYSELSRGVLGTGLGDALTALGWRPAPIPSPYGPLWTNIEAVVMGATTRVPLAILIFKTIATLASLGSIWLVWRILGHVSPGRRLLGTVLFAWNPVIVVELAGEGHNDALMLLFALAGLYATVRLRPAASLVATTLGTLTKVVPVLVLPPQLVFLWRRRTDDPTIVTKLVIGAVASLVLAVVVFLPVWVGFQTFEGLRVSSEPGPWPTISGALYRFIERTRPDVDVGLLVRIIVQGAFLAFVVMASLRVRTSLQMLEASAAIAVAYLLFGSPVYFPWYAVFPVALLALVPRIGTIALVFILAFMSRAIAPLVDLQPQYHPIPIAPFQVTNAGILIGLATFAALVLWAFVRWSSREPDPPGRADLDWLLSGLDRRLGIPAVVTGIADRYTRRSLRPSPMKERLEAAAPGQIEVLTAEEIANRTAPPAKTRDADVTTAAAIDRAAEGAAIATPEPAPQPALDSPADPPPWPTRMRATPATPSTVPGAGVPAPPASSPSDLTPPDDPGRGDRGSA